MRIGGSPWSRPVVVAACAVAAATVWAAPASAAVTMTAPPPSSVSSWTMASTGLNQISGGSLTVSATEPYTVTVTADRSRMTEHDGTSYVSGGKTIAAALQVAATRTGGTAVVPGVGVTATIGTSTTLATGTGVAITGGTDVYSITLKQTTAIGDGALPAGRTYRIVLTYTAAPTL